MEQRSKMGSKTIHLDLVGFDKSGLEPWAIAVRLLRVELSENGDRVGVEDPFIRFSLAPDTDIAEILGRVMVMFPGYGLAESLQTRLETIGSMTWTEAVKEQYSNQPTPITSG